MEKKMKKALCMLLITIMLAGVFGGCGSQKEEDRASEGQTETVVSDEASEKESKETAETAEVQAEDVSDELTGMWCSIDSEQLDGIEFAGADNVTLVNAGKNIPGTYRISGDLIDMKLEGEEDEHLYMKRSGDFLAISMEKEMEYSPQSIYFVREEVKDNYESVRKFTGKNTVWNPESSIGSLEFRGETYNPEELYVEFNSGNIMRISKPEIMGKANVTVLCLAPFVFTDGYKNIEFIFNDPFTGESGNSYAVEVSDEQLVLKGRNVELQFKAVTIK